MDVAKPARQLRVAGFGRGRVEVTEEDHRIARRELSVGAHADGRQGGVADPCVIAHREAIGRFDQGVERMRIDDPQAAAGPDVDGHGERVRLLDDDLVDDRIRAEDAETSDATVRCQDSIRIASTDPGIAVERDRDVGRELLECDDARDAGQDRFDSTVRSPRVVLHVPGHQHDPIADRFCDRQRDPFRPEPGGRHEQQRHKGDRDRRRAQGDGHDACAEQRDEDEMRQEDLPKRRDAGLLRDDERDDDEPDDDRDADGRDPAGRDPTRIRLCLHGSGDARELEPVSRCASVGWAAVSVRGVRPFDLAREVGDRNELLGAGGQIAQTDLARSQLVADDDREMSLVA